MSFYGSIWSHLPEVLILFYDLVNFIANHAVMLSFRVLFILPKKTFSIQVSMSEALQRKYLTYVTLENTCFSFQVFGSLSIP